MSIGILPNVSSIKTNREVKRWISVCSRIRQKCSGYFENCTSVGLYLSRLGAIGFSKRRTGPVKPNAESLGTSSKNTIHSVHATVKQVSGKRKDHRLEKYWSKIPHQRSPYATKIEDRSHEETERQQRCARSKVWNLAKNLYKLKENDKATFLLGPRKNMYSPAASTKEPEERQFTVDSGAGMHMVSKKDFNSAELETMRISRNLTTLVASNGEVQTREEATENVKELDLFVKIMLLEETPAILSHGKLCEDHGYTYHWTSGQKPHLTQNGKRIDCNISNYVPFVVPGLSTSSSASHTHLLLQHLHRRTLYLTSADASKIQ